METKGKDSIVTQITALVKEHAEHLARAAVIEVQLDDIKKALAELTNVLLVPTELRMSEEQKKPRSDRHLITPEIESDLAAIRSAGEIADNSGEAHGKYLYETVR